jgi:phospholipid/cholesterol/gamma-HCH transport system permease protein
MWGWVESVGRRAISALDYLRSLYDLLYLSLKTFATDRRSGVRVIYRVSVDQCYFTGVQAFWFIAFFGFAVGLSLAVLIQGPLLVQFLVKGVVREIAPLLTSFVVLGRSGTAIAVEIGNMKVGHELDLLESMAIDPIRRVVVPRLIGVTFAAACLTVTFDVAACVASFPVAGLSPIEFYRELTRAMTYRDLGISIGKGFLFGITTALIACHHGMTMIPLTTEVPKAATRVVMNSLMFVQSMNIACILMYAT